VVLDRSSIAPIDVGPREQRLHQQLALEEIDALVVTSPTNIRWLTGFAGSSATVVVHEGEITLCTDARYEDRAPGELRRVGSTADVVIASSNLGEAVHELIGATELVGLEADHVSWSLQQTIDQHWLPGQTLVASSGLVDGLRSRKDAAEVERIEYAASIVDESLSTIRKGLIGQLTERQFAQALDHAIRANGADDIGFETIVASGPNGAIPHHSPGDRVISRGDLVIVDVGAMIDGYRSDMTRTFCVGPMSNPQRLHYDTVIAAQQAGVDAMNAGAGTVEVDTAARAVIGKAGWADSFTHGTGHGVGLDIHELPRVGKNVNDVYELGTVATVEPGVYLRGVAGVRIEDTCVVTETGARRLTCFPKDDPEVLS